MFWGIKEKMGSRKKFFVAEKKMQETFDALGEKSGNLERVCSIGIDIYVARNFIRIGSDLRGLFHMEL